MLKIAVNIICRFIIELKLVMNNFLDEFQHTKYLFPATLTVLTVYGGGGFVTTSQPECSNKVGCHQCKLDSGCPSLQSFMTVDEHDCYGTCEFTESCLGIQYDFHTKTCMLFGYNPSCQKVEHVYNGTYVYFRKSCRTGKYT